LTTLVGSEILLGVSLNLLSLKIALESKANQELMAMRLAFHTSEKPRLRSAQRSACHDLARVWSVPASRDVLQAKADRCACGGSCPRCQTKADLKIGEPGDAYEREADTVAERVMGMAGGSGPVASAGSGLQNKCGGCETEGKVATTASSVHEALNSSGQPLAAETRAFFEPRFGHDFSAVRVHSDVTAARSARDMNAKAYTLGHDVVFAAGQFAPRTREGKKLLAHELTHVVQQGAVAVGPKKVTALQRTPNPIDTRAQALITLAQDTTVPIEQRASRLINQMLTTYYPADASKFTQVNWKETNPGVTAVCAQAATPTMTCTIEVGRYFVEQTTSAGISRRVLQLGHEIQHVNQHRQGMGGPARRHEREFLAFYWEASAPEAAGTGRMAHTTRVTLIDAAITNYNCFSAAEKTTYNSQYQQLLTLRQTEQTASGRPPTPVPTQCGG
jgi:hypothetical protein